MTTKTRDHEALADLFPAPKLSAVAKQQRELRYLSSTLERAEANLAAWRKSGGSLNDFEDYWHTPQCKVERCQLRLSEQMATPRRWRTCTDGVTRRAPPSCGSSFPS